MYSEIDDRRRPWALSLMSSLMLRPISDSTHSLEGKPEVSLSSCSRKKIAAGRKNDCSDARARIGVGIGIGDPPWTNVCSIMLRIISTTDGGQMGRIELNLSVIFFVSFVGVLESFQKEWKLTRKSSDAVAGFACTTDWIACDELD